MVGAISLRAGPAHVELRPDAGGRVAQIRVAGRPLLRGEDQCDGSWFSWGSYPLVPWSNRIADGEFWFEGARHRMPVNFSDGTALHGLGAEVEWDVVDTSGRSAVLELAISSGPFELTCRQSFVLAAHRLEQTISVVNRAAHRVPVGVGIHPWLYAGPVAIPATAHWPLRAALPVGPPEPLPADLNLHALADPPPLDHCLTGLTGSRALVPGLALEWSAEVRHVVVYSGVPGWICVEPVSNANDGFNLLAGGTDGHGVIVLEPGGACSATFAFDWSPGSTDHAGNRS